MAGPMSCLKYIKRREVVIALLASLVSRPLSARIITGGKSTLLIAVRGFAGISPDEQKKGHDLALLIASDLRDSGSFMLLDPGKFTEIVINADNVPEFKDWRALSADCLVTGRISLQSDGRFKVEFRLWDVVTGQQLYAAQHFVAPDQLHRVPHIIANSIYEHLIGQVGRFDDNNKN
jgi:TolB protein